MNKISVITICHNNLDELRQTNISVDKQFLPPFEHIIINGSTNTEIKNYLEQTKQPVYRKWINETDHGIADAFNKGILQSKGDIVVMLNSGDMFFDETVIAIVNKTFDQNPSIEWLHGKYKLLRGGSWVIIGKKFEKNKLYRGMRSICHQSMFVKKNLHTKYGLYDISERISMDYDYLCRISNEPFIFLKSPLVVFTPSGTSSQNYLQTLKNAKRIYKKYFGWSFKLGIWQFRLKILYYLLKSPIGNFLYKIKVWLRLENI